MLIEGGPHGKVAGLYERNSEVPVSDIDYGFTQVGSAPTVDLGSLDTDIIQS